MSIYGKLPKEIKKYYERELSQYWNNKELIKNIETTKLNTRRIIFLEKRIQNIEEVISRLSEMELTVFKYIFKYNMDWRFCLTTKNIDKNTYYSILNKVIYMLAEEEGDI